MSDSVRDFFDDLDDDLDDVRDDLGDTVNRAGDDLDDDIDDIRGDLDDGVDDVRNAVDDDDGTPSTTSPAAQVTRLYDTVFDRAPDDAGLTFWTNALRVGVGLDDVAELFVASPEFRDRYGDIGAGEFVNLLYQNVLDREPDPEGQAFWTSNLQSGVLDRDDVVLAFSESPEHVAKVGPVSTDDNPLI